MNVSVVLASYNGAAYIREQLNSILRQLEPDDELIVSDDKSSDATLTILDEYQNIKIIRGRKETVGNNFQNGIMHCRNEIVLFADQDDIWAKGKVKEIKRIFEENDNISVVMHNGRNFGKRKGVLIKKYRKGVLNNIIRSSYWGCCMAVRKDFLLSFIPVNFKILAHDQLIGALSEKYNQTYFYDKILIMHRIHDNNLSRKQPLHKRIKHRIVLFYQYQMCASKIKSKETC